MAHNGSIEGFLLEQSVVTVKGPDGAILCEGVIVAKGTETEMRDYLRGVKPVRKRRSAAKLGDSENLLSA